MDGRAEAIRKVLANLPQSMSNWTPSDPVDWGSNDNRNRAFILANNGGNAYSQTCPDCNADVLTILKIEHRRNR